MLALLEVSNLRQQTNFLIGVTKCRRNDLTISAVATFVSQTTTEIVWISMREVHKKQDRIYLLDVCLRHIRDVLLNINILSDSEYLAKYRLKKEYVAIVCERAKRETRKTSRNIYNCEKITSVVSSYQQSLGL